ncbi:alpha-beta hydrolase superfamily lysophospholipase [Okibacterium sp. HSC-33S16]|uniref:alpha/beta hydrolase family protein n=1 Tax=Okibacterium sp. HSC-33S16 TaxID=2910965 RepID=UPI00209EB6FD|nr:alpha/beta fold hydrolase [Okibacterium sp. HSC-33S16]MCP2030798.1 alpha-beta hydrolase superfamily lysophospholipase [Okibacterium sp. HSC-33S16]
MSYAAAGFVVTVATASVFFVSAVARRVVTPAKKRAQDTDVRALNRADGTVTLSRTPDTSLPGRYGLWFGADDRYLQLGPIVDQDASTVTRVLDTPTSELVGLPDAGPATFSGWYYSRPEQLGLPFSETVIETTPGPAPAWLFPADEDSGRWVIGVHGRGTTRSECLRSVPVLHDAGCTSLLISYRNDGDAPPSADGLYGLGDTEWQDVEAAIEFATAHGATSIVLMGWSMGGAISLQTSLRSALADRITGIILESAVVDWGSVLEFQADAGRIPVFVRRAAIAAISNGWGKSLTGLDTVVNFTALDMVERSGELTKPMLVLHSDDDGFVPADAARELAIRRSDLATFVPFRTARHTKLWNFDEPRWTTAIRDWLAGN